MRDEQRKAGIAARNRLTREEITCLSHAIVEDIISSHFWREAKIILSYRAVGCEVDLSELDAYALKEGKKICYPLCTAPGEMIALLPDSPESWRKGSYGIPEPIRENSEEVTPGNLDLVLCPCTAYDKANHRMGMGGGYYDRYLPRCVRARVTAVAFRVQECESLAAEIWDVDMEHVFSR